MALTVKVTNDAYPTNTEFGVIGLGVFVNGEAREVTEEEEAAFASFTGELAHEKLDENKAFEVTGTPTLTDISTIIPAEISDTPSSDPTAMNLVHGEVFAEANLGGATTEPDEVAVVTEEPVKEDVKPSDTTTTVDPMNDPMAGGGN